MSRPDFVAFVSGGASTFFSSAFFLSSCFFLGAGVTSLRAASTPPSDCHVGTPGVAGSSSMVTSLTCTRQTPPLWTCGPIWPSSAMFLSVSV
jgi:hypothetical protein